MATDGKATWWNASAGTPAYLAQELRQIDALGVMPGPASEPFSGRPGRRVSGGGLNISVSSTGNGTVSASAGTCLLYASSQASQGVWRLQFPDIGPIALGARPGAGTSRIVLVVARLYDSDIGVGAVKEAKIEVVAGTAAASPSAPSISSAWIHHELGRLTVPASGTITFTQSTQKTVAAGGVLPVTTTAEMDKLKTEGIAYRDMVVGNTQTDSLHRYDGTNWKRLVEVPTAQQFFGKRWGVDYNPAVHVPKSIHLSPVETTTAGGLLRVSDNLGDHFAGVAAIHVTPGDTSGGLRYAMGIIGTDPGAADALDAYCYVPGGGGVVSQAVRVDVTIHGWR